MNSPNLQAPESPPSPKRPVKMSALAALSGVPAATIKHYIREGLLPQATRRTSKNMAFYDPQLADRIRQIKTLQREHFLPLRAIKSVLDNKQPSKDEDAATAKAIQRALESMESHEARTRRELIAAGTTAQDLAFFTALGLITPIKTSDSDSSEDCFRGDDLALLRVLGTSRREGLTHEMLPRDIVGPYVQAIAELVRIELDMFRRGVVPRAGKKLPQLTDAATRLSEQLVVLIRRKMLLPMLGDLVRTHAEEAAAPAPTKNKSKPRTRHKSKRETDLT